MSKLKQFLAFTVAMAAMSDVNYYDGPFTRFKCTKSLTPSEVNAKAKRKKRIVQLRKLK